MFGARLQDQVGLCRHILQESCLIPHVYSTSYDCLGLLSHLIGTCITVRIQMCMRTMLWHPPLCSCCSTCSCQWSMSVLHQLMHQVATLHCVTVCCDVLLVLIDLMVCIARPTCWEDCLLNHHSAAWLRPRRRPTAQACNTD